MAPKKGGPQEKVEAHTVLTAVVLADSFTQRFRPITVEQPKALLPLVNVPMIEYTLEWLAMNKVEEIFLFCCAHAHRIQAYLAGSKWGSSSRPKVTVIVSTNCLSAGEALRSVDERNIIKSDFILVSADTVSNMQLGPVLAAHMKRRAEDKNAIMTMVMKPIRHPLQRLRLGDSELIVTLDSTTNRLLKYTETDGRRAGAPVMLDAALFSERDCVQVRSDLMDSHISICAPEVLMLFSDNFDYQNVKRDFVTGVLSEEELGHKLYVHELGSEYAARIHNLRSYDAVSRDIMQRWVYPFVPDTNLLHAPDGSGASGLTSYSYARGQRYVEEGVSVARHAHVGEDVCAGAGTSIGEYARVAQSVIGRNCRIGANVSLLGCYIQDNVTIHDGAQLRFSMVCERAVVRPGAVLNPGSIVSYGVVIGSKHSVQSYSHLSLCKQREATGNASDDELEYSSVALGGKGKAKGAAQGGDSDESDDESDDDSEDDSDTEDEDSQVIGGSLGKPTTAAARAALSLAMGQAVGKQWFEESVVGLAGAGYLWQGREETGFDREQYSIAPPHIRQETESSASTAEQEEAEAAAAAAGGKPDGAAGSSGSKAARDAQAALGRRSGAGQDDDGDEGESDELERHPDVTWKLEVEETFLRCIQLRFDPNNVVIELNGLKIAEDRTFADCGRHMLTALLGLCLPPPRGAKDEYKPLYAPCPPNTGTSEGKLSLLRTFKKFLGEWKELLQRFLRDTDDQVELLLTLEEYCSEEGVFEGAGQGAAFADIFPQVLQQLYEVDVVSEDAFLAWAGEKAHADEDERVYLVKAQAFIAWLQEEDSDSEEEGEESD
ncbi:MAG: hypothetical protein WDW36_007300 [Sanguina aurantia]